MHFTPATFRHGGEAPLRASTPRRRRAVPADAAREEIDMSFNWKG